MAPVVQNLTIRKGRTFSYSVACTDSDGAVRDLTGYTGEMQIRETPGSDTILGTATVTIDTDTGLVTASIAAGTTEGYAWTSGVYDLVIVSGSIEEQIAEGRIGVKSTVTR